MKELQSSSPRPKNKTVTRTMTTVRLSAKNRANGCRGSVSNLDGFIWRYLDPGNPRRVRAGHAGISAKVGDSFLTKEIFIQQRLAGNLGRIFLNELENAIHQNVRLAPGFSA